MTRRDFLDKVDYEGGVGEALFYFGRITGFEYDLPVEFVKDWNTAYEIVQRLQDQMNEWEAETELDLDQEDEELEDE